jgi:ribosomal protein L37AE/L43A
MSTVLETLICPKCGHKLKPSLKVIPRFSDLLVCRYCKISVKVSLIRTQKDPQGFLDRFKKIPEGTEIKEVEVELEKIELLEEHFNNLAKYKHTRVPKKCPYCQSEDLVADSYDNCWICLSCDSYFKWVLYEVAIHGQVSVLASDEDIAEEKACSYIGDDCRIDFESFVIREG